MVTTLKKGLQVLDVTSRERWLNYQNYPKVKGAHSSIAQSGKSNLEIVISEEVSPSLKLLPHLSHWASQGAHDAILSIPTFL